MGIFDTKNALSPSEQGFSQRRSLLDKTHIGWGEIIYVEGIKRDLITYQDHLIIIVTSKHRVAISEVDKGFEAFEKALLSMLSGFPPNWYELIEIQPFEQPFTLWKST